MGTTPPKANQAIPTPIPPPHSATATPTPTSYSLISSLSVDQRKMSAPAAVPQEWTLSPAEAQVTYQSPESKHVKGISENGENRKN